MKFKKLLMVAMALIMSVACFAGCGGGGNKVDTSKSQLNVGIFKSGIGTAWLDNAIADFEAYYANKRFQEGKKGVQVIKDERTEEFGATQFPNNAPGLANTVYFLEQSNYDTFISNGLLADITELVNEDVYDDNGDLVQEGTTGTTSILDTMYDSFDGYYERDGKIYAIPYRLFTKGIFYDADLFNESRLYFRANGTIGANQADIDAGNCGTGPDGVLGTADDGLAETYEDFKKLLNAMTEKDIIPFTWSTNTSYQRNYAYEAFWANYEGANDFALNWSFDGTMSDGTTVVNENNLTPLINQQGRKAAIQLFNDISSNENYYSPSVKSTNTHTSTQSEFIYSRINNTKKPIAMLFEGGYWESESRQVFADSAKRYNDPSLDYGLRDFRLMAVPNFVGTTGIADQTNTSEKEVILASEEDSIICIAAKNKAEYPEVQLEIAKLFVQFVQSRGQLANFTRDTGACFRPYNFEANETEIKSWTKLGQNVYRYLEEGATMIPDISNSRKRNEIAAAGTGWSFKYVENSTYNTPIEVFFKFSNKTVDEVFEGVKRQLNSMAGI